MSGNTEKKVGSDFEEVKRSEALEEQIRKDAEFAKYMEDVDDIG